MKDLGLTYSKRFEKKFILEKSKVDKYITENKQYLSKKFSSDLFLKDSSYTIIRNIYFDDENLTSYHDSVGKAKKREKIRARTYAENGNETDYIFLEVKTKENAETTKGRIMLKKKWYNDFVFYGKINVNKLLELNCDTKKEKVLSTLDTISNYIHKKNYKPMLINQYKRRAFKFKKDHKLRLTIDSELFFEKIGQAETPRQEYLKTIKKNDVIIEAKYKNVELYQKEFLKLTDDLTGTSQGFSKYCYSIYQSFQNEPTKEKEVNTINLISETIKQKTSFAGMLTN